MTERRTRKMNTSMQLLRICALSVLLSLFPAFAFGQWSEGMFFREAGTPAVYYLENGVKRYIGTPDLIRCLGSQPDDEIEIGENDFNAIPTGPPKTDCATSMPRRPIVGGHEHTYFEGSRHVESRIFMYRNGATFGWFRFANDTVAHGYCASYAVGLLDDGGRQLYGFTPPGGCLDGKVAGHENVRFINWNDSAPSEIGPKVASIKIKIQETDGPNRLSDWVNSATDIADKLAKIAQILGVAVAASP